MKKVILLLAAVSLSFLFSARGAIAESGGIKVDKDIVVTIAGSVVKFDPRDNVPDVDLSKVTFDLAAVPPEAQFMVGKIYRGQSERNGIKGALWYFFLEQWNKDGAVFVVSQWSGNGNVFVFRNACPAFKLTEDRFAPDTPKCRSGAGNVGNGWKFFRNAKRGVLVFGADDGAEIEADEVGTLPPEMVTRMTKSSPEVVKVEGNVLKFQALRRVPDVDLSKIKFDFSEIHPEDAFMQGNVYVGRFRKDVHLGSTWYLFLVSATEKEGNIFLVGQQSSDYNAGDKIISLVCNSKTQKCTVDKGKNSWDFSKDKEGNLVFVSSDGWKNTLVKGGTLPPEVFAGAAK